MFVAPIGMLAIKFLKIDVTMYLFELRIAFACVTCLNFLCKPRRALLDLDKARQESLGEC